ncbi:KUP/HAK/KT family potassium transporter [Cupriavidus basilensis]
MSAWSSLASSRADIPYVDDEHRLSCKDLGGGMYILKSDYGFKGTPDVHKVLELAQLKLGMHFELMETSFFIARRSVIPSKLPGMSMWRESLFAWMHQRRRQAVRLLPDSRQPRGRARHESRDLTGSVWQHKAPHGASLRGLCLWEPSGGHGR